MKKIFYLILVQFLIISLNANDSIQIGEPYVWRNDTVLFIYSNLGPFSAKERIEALEERIRKISVYNKQEIEDSLLIIENSTDYEVIYGSQKLLIITENDAKLAGLNKLELATSNLKAIESILLSKRASQSWKFWLLNIPILILCLIGLFYGVKYLNRLFTFFEIKVIRLQTRFKISELRFFKFFLKFVTPERQKFFIAYTVRIIKWVTIVFLLFLVVPFLFELLPWARGYAMEIYSYILSPLKFVFNAFTNYLPNIFFIAVIIFVTKYSLKFIKYFADEIESGNIEFPGFYSDWAKPTYKLVRGLVYVFAFVIIFPYLPGSDSPAFKGISVFLGVLLSLGSTSATSNIIAGVVITYMRPFQVGDRVKIADTVGDVVQRTLLVTRIKTIKNEDITIPNSNILGNHLWNFSENKENLGIILHTAVTIGYDVPWQKVHELLIDAADKCDMLEKEPKPFVLQTSLDDFYVSYELNAHSKVPEKMAIIYSEIHKHIIENFNREAIEILSPHYRAVRDGNILTIPEENIPEGYQRPGFNMEK